MNKRYAWQKHIAAWLIIPCVLLSAFFLLPRTTEAAAMVTNFYQRVAACTLKYMLNDNDGYPLITGIANVDNLSVTVGSDPVPYDFTITDDTARYHTTTDIYGWKVEPEITLQNTN